ncbi:MAG TPA: lactonase family protein [Acidimicrobiales bacterium]|nr:lactonase family protein [Acidimicrobiales bacterium]
MLGTAGPGSRRYWCGSYTEQGGEGIYLLERAGGDGPLHVVGLAAPATSPSFLALHPSKPVLYAVLEGDVGQVEAFAVRAGGELASIGRAPSLGSQPCHLSVLPASGAVAAANYGSGEIVVIPTDQSGGFSARAPRSLAGHGRGPDTQHQDGPHAHVVAPAPDGHILAADLGADLVRIFTEDPSLPELRPVAEMNLPAGGGPRHMAFGPYPFVYVLLELTSSVAVLRAEGTYSRLSLLDEVPAFVEPVPAGTWAAEITYQQRHGMLYVSLRGADRICSLRADDGGQRLKVVAETPSGGRWPRHFLIDGQMMYVANQYSNEVTCLGIRDADGALFPTGQAAEVPAPACLLPVPAS